MSFTYKGLTAHLNRHIITAEEVDSQLHRLVQQNPRIAVIQDRPTRLGDEVILDYAGFCGEEQFAGGTAEKQTLVLGSGMFIPGFEEQLVDKVPGEEVLVNVTFPEEYHSPDLAGKEAQFRCKIHEIRVKTHYELDDTFAKEFGQCDTLDELRKKLEDTLQAYSDERGEMDLQDRLLRQAAETLEFNPTEEELEAAVDAHMANMEAQMSRQGLNLEMYCSFLNTTVEQLRTDCRGEAAANLRAQATVDKIVQLENLKATPEEMGEALVLVCRQNNMTMEQLKPYVDAEFEKAIETNVLTGKVLGLIRDAATVTVGVDNEQK